MLLDANLHVKCSFGTTAQQTVHCVPSVKIIPLTGTSLNNELGAVVAYCNVRAGTFGHNTGPVFELGISHY